MPWKRAKALPPPDNSLFEACFRIQREAGEAAGWHIPLIVENVKGAQQWVGRARWHYGSFYLWGDVPALMAVTPRKKLRRCEFCGYDFPEELGRYGCPNCNGEGLKDSAIKQHGSGAKWFDLGICAHGSQSDARKAASAQIAKIPFPLAQYIAQVFKPEREQAQTTPHRAQVHTNPEAERI